MPTVDEVIASVLPETLRRFMRESCRIAADAFHPLAATSVPEPARRLLVHSNDMTSTLAAFHESTLRVEVLQRQRENELYLREVFLRTKPGDAIVEYGVIAIALEQFTPEQQQAVQAGQIPLGGLLHRFKIAFESAPIGFFSASGAALARTPLSAPTDATCFGRFNRLTKPGGEPLAWILEILPPALA
jgi:chorismate-pyruvate lyase